MTTPEDQVRILLMNNGMHLICRVVEIRNDGLTVEGVMVTHPLYIAMKEGGLIDLKPYISSMCVYDATEPLFLSRSLYQHDFDVRLELKRKYLELTTGIVQAPAGALAALDKQKKTVIIS